MTPTPLEVVYKFFLARIQTDEWIDPEQIEVYEAEWRDILDMARFYFRYPRRNINIDLEADTFVDELTNDEIQVLAILMKQEWLARCVSTMEHIRSGYDERDWKKSSQANQLDKLIKYQEFTAKESNRALFNYSRSENFKPLHFQYLAGKKR